MARYNNGGSSTLIMELPSMTSTTNNSRPSSTKDVHFLHEGVRSASSSTPPPPEGQLPAPSTAVRQQARWNFPRINIFRFLATLWSFIVLGLNDAAIGPLIPYLEEYYGVNYTIISLIFLSPTAGYITSALTNNMMHVHFGQRGVGIIMALGHILSYVIICLHPPYPVLVLACIIAGYANGLGDSAWNAWVGDMANPNELLGFLHAAYGLGATIAPLVATTLITKAGWPWYRYYYFMVAAAVLELIFLAVSFWAATGAAYRADHAAIERESDSGSSTPTTTLAGGPIPIPTATRRAWYIRANPFANPNSRTAEAVKNRVTIIASLFLLLYVGAEVTLGGWLVTFMLNVRHGEAFASGLTSTGFWLGITVGRLVLGFVTGRLFKTEKHAIAVYLVLCVALELLFWLIPQFIVSAVMVSLLGFFLAPMFPAAVVAMTKLLPKRLHVASIGFAAALGASGACIFPFATGAIANAKGVYVLQPIVLAMLVVTLGLWMLIPAIPKSRTQ